jgi:hypothetical protein
MSRRGPILVALLLVMAVAPGSATAERCPCDLLLLPYLEVQLPGPDHEDPYVQRTTTFAVGNYGDGPVGVELALWTNWGIAVHRSTVDLAAKAVLTVNLRDWLVFGHFPGGDLDVATLEHLQAALAGIRSPRDGRFYARAVADRLLVGYLTARIVAGQYEPGGLWGDVFTLHAEADLAAGESLVRLVADDTREVCERHLIRYVQGGTFDGGTQFVFWTGVAGHPSTEPEFPVPAVDAHCKVFDEAGRLLREQTFALIATQAIDVGALGWSEPFGWVDCVTATPSFACAGHSARGHDDVLQRSYCVPEEEGGGGQVHPRIDLEKYVEGVDADTPPGPVVPAGEEVTWTYVVTNTGTLDLVEVEVTDDQGIEVSCPETGLGRWQTMTCSAHGEAPLGQHRNVGTVHARSEDGQWVGDSDPSHCFGLEPGIHLEKRTNGEDADQPPGPTIPLGSPVQWTYVVTNTGNSPLANVAVVDDRGVAVTCPKTTLAVGETMTCVAAGTAVCGQYHNVGTATGLSETGAPVSAPDASHYFGSSHPAIDVEKHVNGQDADTPETAVSVLVGAPVVWEFAVTNVGDVTLSGIAVADNPLGPVSCPQTSLGPGQTMTCTSMTGVAAAGVQGNEAAAAGNGVCGQQVSDTDPAYYEGVCGQPAIHLTKYVKDRYGNWQHVGSCDGPIPNLENREVWWKFVVTNDSDVPLFDVQIWDDDFGGLTCPVIPVLAPHGSWGVNGECIRQGPAADLTFAPPIGSQAGPDGTECECRCNVASAVGATPCGGEVSDEDASCYYR